MSLAVRLQIQVAKVCREVEMEYDVNEVGTETVHDDLAFNQC